MCGARSWGEAGYIRLERTSDGLPCGTDERAQDGTACKDDPTTATVCGTSGILFDTSYPTGGYLIDDAAADPVARPAPTLRGGALA